MKVDIEGRLRNIKLPKTRPLLPLFEAVMNSLQSIDLSAASRRNVRILIGRKGAPDLELGQRDLEAIESFEIIDTGAGFNDLNFGEFETSDSRSKIEMGGKGIGRFLWLKAFEEVEVESTFKEDGEWKKRKFSFSIGHANGVKGGKKEKALTSKPETRVLLKGFREEYEEACPKKAGTIADKMIEHFLSWFLRDNCPRVIIEDGDAVLDLNDKFDKEIRPSLKQIDFKIGTVSFKLVHSKIFSADERVHELVFCADQREVRELRLKATLPELSQKLKDDKGESFVYVGYLYSKYLDKNVNQERTDFSFPEGDAVLFGVDDLSLQQISKNAGEHILTYLKKVLDPMRAEQSQRIEVLIKNVAPGLSYMLEDPEKYLSDVPFGMSDEKIEQELQKKKFIETKEIRKEIEKLVNSDLDANFDFKTEMVRVLSEASKFGAAHLAEYVSFRKIILGLFQKALFKNKDDETALEQFIHELVFPRFKTSEQVCLERQNLWVLDEKLSFSNYVASDKPISSIKGMNSTQRTRPDLVTFFDSVYSFGEGEKPFRSMVVVEFKKPLAKGVTTGKQNPFQKVTEYIADIRQGRITDSNGRPLGPQEKEAMAFGYIICDITPEIEMEAKKSGYTQNLDGTGFYFVNSALRAVIEVVSYDSVLANAQKRNRIFFEKLGIV